MLRDQVRAEIALTISEVYETLQGEGLLAGTPVLLIRLQGCNLRCPWCDQPESLDPEGGKRVGLGELLERARSSPFRHALVTGGEPFLHPELPDLIRVLLAEGFSVQIETNGTLWIPDMAEVIHRVHVTCSPKGVAGYRVHPRLLKHVSELKFVVDEELGEGVLLREEFLPLLEGGRVVLQAESNREDMFGKALLLQRKLAERGYTIRVIPQIHKVIGIP